MNNTLVSRISQFGQAIVIISLLLCSNAQATQPIVSVPAQGLVAYYPFEDDFQSYSTNNYNGQGMNGTGFTDGIIGHAASFDGIDDYVQLPAGFADFINGFSLSYWAKVDKLQPYQRIIDFGNGAGGSNIIFSNYESSNTGRLIVYNGSTSHRNACDNYFILNEWHHYCVTLTGSGQAAFYRDGQLQSLSTTEVAIPDNVTRTQNFIGKSNFSGNSLFSGKLDELVIYNRALDSNEITTLYRVGSTVPAPSTQVTVTGDGIPKGINYQGRITDANGNNPPNGGGYAIEVKIWDAQVEGNLIWGATYTGVAIRNGSFNIPLGATNGIAMQAQKSNLLDAFSEPNRYIGITVVKDSNGQSINMPSEILPRQQLLAVPYAVNADTARIAQTVVDGIPVGTILPFAGSSIPSGYLLCDGRIASGETYTRLYQAIGEVWGNGGDGAGSLFNLPDLRGRVPAGAGGTGTALYAEQITVGQLGGEAKHQLTVDEMPAHNHLNPLVSNVIGSDGSNGNPFSIGGGNIVKDQAFLSKGGDQPHNNMQPFAGVNYIIKY